MALMTARRLVVRGRPPGRAAVRIGATSVQASSVKSVWYNLSVFSTDQLYTDGGELFKHPLSGAWSSATPSRRKKRFDQFPGCIRQVRVELCIPHQHVSRGPFDALPATLDADTS